MAPAVVIRHEVRGGVGAAIRDGWLRGIERGRPYLALAVRRRPARARPSCQARSTRSQAADADYVQGSRWMRRRPGHRRRAAGRGLGTRIYSLAFSVLGGRRVTDATNGFRIFRASILRDPKVDIDQPWLTATTWSRTCCTRRSAAATRSSSIPVTVVYHRDESYTKMRGIKDWWRLFRPALLLRLG